MSICTEAILLSCRLTYGSIVLVKLVKLCLCAGNYSLIVVMGPGFFAAVNITTKGVWPPNVEVEKYTLSTVVA